MSGNLWRISHQLDDEDLEMARREYITYYQGADYYRLGLKMFTRLAHEAGAVYKYCRRVMVKRDIFEAYLREIFDENFSEELSEQAERKMEKGFRQGAVVEDAETGILDIRFGLNEYYGGLHCNDNLQVLVDDDWIPTKLEMNAGWHFTGIETDNLLGLTVRIKC